MCSFSIKLLQRGGFFILLLGLGTFLWTQRCGNYREHILPNAAESVLQNSLSTFLLVDFRSEKLQTHYARNGQLCFASLCRQHAATL